MAKYWKQQLPIIKEEIWNTLVEKKIKLKEEQQWNETRLSSTKLEVYNTLKIKKNWDDILNEQDILAKAITLRLKSGANFLQLDKGMQSNIERKLRLCQGCKEHIEDEEHFLLKCKNYKSIREKILQPISNWTKKKKMKLLLGHNFKIDAATTKKKRKEKR